MIKGEGYLGARTRQTPTARTIKKLSMQVRGVVCRSTRTQSLTVIACVILSPTENAAAPTRRSQRYEPILGDKKGVQ